MDTWSLISDRQKALQSFYNQVDKTRNRLNLTPFKMLNYDGKTKMDDVIIVTENQSSTYMKRIISGLMTSKWQAVIDGQLTTRESHKIEQFNEAAMQQADEYLFNQYGITGLDVWLDNHVCHTGLIGVQWMVSIEDGVYKVHCLPLDMRWTPFVLNKWQAPITYRDKEDLLRELEDYKKLSMDDETGTYEFGGLDVTKLKDTDNEVRDYWDEGKNELWVEQQLCFKQKNTYGTLPSVIVWVPSGYFFRDKGYIEHESPSIIAVNEALYEQKSRQSTIDATLGFNVLNPATEYETKNPTGGVSRPRPKAGEDLEVPEGERHLPVPSPDINRAELASRDEVNRMIDSAAPISPRSYTTPPSAIEVTTEVELLDELQNPRIIALQMFKSQLAKLNIEQTIMIGDGEVIIGREGSQKNLNISDLKDPKKYFVNYQLMKQNKRLAIVNEARALAMWGRAPIKYILRDVLAVEDPDGWQREMELEQAKALNPAIGLAEMAVRYAEEAEAMEDGPDKDLKNWQSRLLQHDYVQLMRQRMQPVQPAETQNLREATKEMGNAQGLISLVGQKGSLVSRGGVI